MRRPAAPDPTMLHLPPKRGGVDGAEQGPKRHRRLRCPLMVSARQQPQRIVIIDDHIAFTEALTLAINLTPDLVCVGTATSAHDLPDLRPGAADLLICDQHLANGGSGVELLGELRTSGNRMPVMLLTGFPTASLLRQAGSLDVAIVSKATPVKELVLALRTMAAGGRPECVVDPDDFDLLSPGELRVLERLGEGVRATEIAEELTLSVHTVRDHIKAVLRKLEASSQLEAVIEAQRQGLISPPN